MKKIQLTLLLTFICGVAFAGSITYTKDFLPIVDVSCITEDNLTPETVIRIPAFTELPIDCLLKGDCFELVKGESPVGCLVVKKDLYVRCSSEELLLSFDLVEWKSLTELTTGSFSINLNNQDGKSSLVLGADLSERKE